MSVVKREEEEGESSFGVLVEECVMEECLERVGVREGEVRKKRLSVDEEGMEEGEGVVELRKELCRGVRGEEESYGRCYIIIIIINK